MKKSLDLLNNLRVLDHLVLDQGHNKLRDDSCHFAPVFVVFRNALRLLEVFQSKSLNELAR